MLIDYLNLSPIELEWVKLKAGRQKIVLQIAQMRNRPMEKKTRIITNNVPRKILYWEELSPEEQREFDHYDATNSMFARYKGNIYDIGDFQRIPTLATDLRGWDGYSPDSFFSGILVKFTPDNDNVIMGWYLS